MKIIMLRNTIILCLLLVFIAGCGGVTGYWSNCNFDDHSDIQYGKVPPPINSEPKIEKK